MRVKVIGAYKREKFSKSRKKTQNTVRANAKKAQKKSKEKSKVHSGAPCSFGLAEKVCIRVEGLNRAKLLYLLDQETIRVEKVRIYGGKITEFVIKKKDCAKTFAICKGMCYNYSVIRRSGLVSYARSLLPRVGIFAGAIIATLVGFVSGSVLVGVEINELENIARADFVAYLQDNGIGVGTMLWNVSADSVRKVALAYSGVAECSVVIDGNVLSLTIIERKAPAGEDGGFCEVVATKDAVVTSVVCKSGTARVKSGQVVSKGQTLIEGAVYDENGEKLKDVTASGIVYGKIAERYEHTVSESYIEVRRTGRSKRINGFWLFGSEIFKPTSPYSQCECESSVVGLGNILPLSVISVVYYETETVEIKTDLESLAARYEEKYAAEFVQTPLSLSTVSRIEDAGGGRKRIVIYVQAEIIISDGV